MLKQNYFKDSSSPSALIRITLLFLVIPSYYYSVIFQNILFFFSAVQQNVLRYHYPNTTELVKFQ